MPSRTAFTAGVLLLLVIAMKLPLAAADTPQAFLGARIFPIEGEVIDNGVLIIEGKRILGVGSADEVEVPQNAQRISVKGKVIMPGLICTHSHIGGVGAADGSEPIQPGVRVFDSINIHDTGFRRAVAGGLTSLNIMPGSGHLSSGQTAYVKLRFHQGRPRRVEDLFIRDADGRLLGGLKMANGTNSMRDPPFPGTRGKSAFMVRQKFILAREYHRKIMLADGDPNKMPPRDLHLETLVEVMQGKRVVHHHTHRHDDIMTVLRLANEFSFRVILHHVSEGWKVAQEIAAAGAPCSIILVDSPGGKLEARYLRFETGRILEEAGVLVAFHTDDFITDSRYFFRMAAMAVRAGMSRRKALEGLTLAGARMMDLDDRIGSLKAGKDADFIILDGDPLSLYTKVMETWVEGKQVFDRSDPEDRLFAVGGFGAGYQTAPYMCCHDESQVGGGR